MKNKQQIELAILGNTLVVVFFGIVILLGYCNQHRSHLDLMKALVQRDTNIEFNKKVYETTYCRTLQSDLLSSRDLELRSAFVDGNITHSPYYSSRRNLEALAYEGKNFRALLEEDFKH